MIRLFFVGDGPRDEATIPPLVKTILEREFDQEFRAWGKMRFHGGGRNERLGPFGRKLLFALRQARDAQTDGLVATVDEDRHGSERLRQLQKARTADRRQRPSFPTALGQAKPHTEAWLLDDPVAVREAFELPSDAAIPSVRRTTYPKQKLHELWKGSPRREADPGATELSALRDVADRVQRSRCAHRQKTGFDSFVKDVRRELGALVNPGAPRG